MQMVIPIQALILLRFKKTDYSLVYADYPVTVFGEHDIAYVSPNVTVLASNCAQITGNDGGYIIFK